MSKLTCQISISLDGCVAGPNQSLDNPLGEGGERLHEWALATDSWRRMHGREGGEPGVDAKILEEVVEGVGAHIMGRNMFGGGDGPWDESWKGWWGDDPPFHAPVFVLSHHERAPRRVAATSRSAGARTRSSSTSPRACSTSSTCTSSRSSSVVENGSSRTSETPCSSRSKRSTPRASRT